VNGNRLAGYPRTSFTFISGLTRAVQGKEELAKLKRLRRLAMRLVGGDASNVPIVHPIRWPGSWHRKREPRLCEIEALELDREIDLDAALAALGAALPADDPKGNGGQHSNDDGDAERPDWAKLTANIVAGKDLHESTMRLAASYVGIGMKPEQALRQLQALMSASTVPQDERWKARVNDLGRLVADAQLKFGEVKARDAGDEPNKVYWHGEVDYRESRPYLVQDVIPEVSHGLMSGQWGTFKTFVAFDLAHSTLIRLCL
jgi:hypothetical protein